MYKRYGAAWLMAAVLALLPLASARADTVSDVTQLNPIAVESVVTPASVEEISQLVRNHNGPVSIGGARHSQGGQTACTGCLFVDMRHFNHVLAFDPKAKVITVQAGITWRAVQEAIDAENLSVHIMQSYANFTVGGALSVNAHGNYFNEGPVVNSVRSFKIVLADGTIKTASRDENPDIFYGAIGGYGGLGIIVEVTLELVDNQPLERIARRVSLSDYKRYYLDSVASNPAAILHYGTLYPPEYKTISAVTYYATDKPVTIAARLAPPAHPSAFDHLMLDFVTGTGLGKWVREYLYDPVDGGAHQVVWRNYATSTDANILEPASRAHVTYVLQEYFVPADKFDDFVTRMAGILKTSKANVLNVAIRHSPAEPGTLLSWARSDTFCFVLYYAQGTKPEDEAKVKAWTSDLIQAAIDDGGDYYLPYQIIASKDQFMKAYSRAGDYFALKQRLDPTYKFHNKLWEAYYAPALP
jgi:FAD/FMN-containing dehydrogenase